MLCPPGQPASQPARKKRDPVAAAEQVLVQTEVGHGEPVS